MLTVQVLDSPHAAAVAEALSARGDGLLEVAVVAEPGAAAAVLGAEVLPADAAEVCRTRLLPFARALVDGVAPPAGPPVLVPHDPAVPRFAADLLRRLRAELLRRRCDDGSGSYDHIGSTSVPDLLAKRFVDLQLGVRSLPERDGEFDRVLRRFGFQPEYGARPDSPGVHRDNPRSSSSAPEALYRKRLFVRPDPRWPTILHVRLLDSPWWSYSLAFRDWLRTNTAGRRAYQEFKQRAARAHAGDGDYDDYTRAKTAFFDRYDSEITDFEQTWRYQR